MCPKKIEQEKLKNRVWLRSFFHWISKGAVKSVNFSGPCPTWQIKPGLNHQMAVKKRYLKKGGEKYAQRR
jgi:hypothetical protein